MASIFKRGPDKKNRKIPYFVEYVDENGKRRRVLGFTDENLSKELGAKLDGDVRLRKLGLLDPQAEKLADERKLPIADHLAKFEKGMQQRGTTGKHVKLTMTRVRAIIAGCGIETLSDLTPERVQGFLGDHRDEEDLGAKTYNHYVQAIDSFGRWLVRSGRLVANPLLSLSRLNTEVDVRHQRRALMPDEVSKLISSARTGGERIQGYNGEQRARVYLVSFLTGLRRSEIASLTPQSFDLDSPQPTVTVAAACSKHRRTDVLPLHRDLALSMRQWLVGVKAGQLLFPKLERKKTWLMVKKDLERVGIAYETEAGIADFHAAGRHTHITELLRNGASLVEAKELARHSDVKMTMRYTHIGLLDQARALASLPAPAMHDDGASQCPSQHASSSNGQTGANVDAAWHDGNKKPETLNLDGSQGSDVSGQSVAESGTDSAEWRRRESNPRPAICPWGLLRA